MRVGLGQILQICLKLEMLYTMNMALFKIFIYEAGCLWAISHHHSQAAQKIKLSQPSRDDGISSMQFQWHLCRPQALRTLQILWLKWSTWSNLQQLWGWSSLVFCKKREREREREGMDKSRRCLPHDERVRGTRNIWALPMDCYSSPQATTISLDLCYWTPAVK